jgi:transcription elongation GreA/GreB family factor
MPATQLMELARLGDVDAFESGCLEALEQGALRLADLVQPFTLLGAHAKADRVAAIGLTVLENTEATQNTAAALSIARVTLLADPDNAALRQSVAGFYRAIHGETPGFDMVLEQSGLLAGRPPRNALRVLDFCLSLKPGDPLLSRTEETLVEVVNIDHAGGLYSVARGGRPTTLPTVEIARRYEHVDPEDFRVLRELRPERLRELIETNPVALVIGLIRARGEWIDQEALKTELVPRNISDADWPKWWTRARAAMKRDPHIVLEGRNPLIIHYSAKARTLEDETWEAIQRQNQPAEWLDTLAGYLREKRANKEAPNPDFIARCEAHLLGQAQRATARRPTEALSVFLVLAQLERQAGLNGDQHVSRAAALLREAPQPVDLIAALPDAGLLEMAAELLPSARPDDGPALLVQLMPSAPAALLDRIVEVGLAAGLGQAVQSHIDTALADPVDYPELIYWLWKGPHATASLRLPADEDLLSGIMLTLSALGRSLHPREATMKAFRAKVKAALGLKDFAKLKACLVRIDTSRAITLKHQLQRMEGLGDTTPGRMTDLLRERFPDLWKVVEVKLQPWEDPEMLFGTRAGLERKIEERDHLVNVTMRENAKRIGEAAALGDLSENSEYKFALEERDLLRARLAQMNSDLSLAVEIDPHRVPTDHVGVGSRVVLRRIDGAAERRLTFLGPFDSDVERGILNYRAPVSQKLMGLRTGDRVRLLLDDAEAEYEVAAIENGLLSTT